MHQIYPWKLLSTKLGTTSLNYSLSSVPKAERKSGGSVANVQTRPFNGGSYLWPYTPKHFQETICPCNTLTNPSLWSTLFPLLKTSHQPPSFICCHPKHPAEHEAQHQPPSSLFFIVPASCCTFLLTPCCCPPFATPASSSSPPPLLTPKLPPPIPVSC